MDRFAKNTFPPYFISGCVYLSLDCKKHWKMVMTMYGYCLQVSHKNRRQSYMYIKRFRLERIIKLIINLISSHRGSPNIQRQPLADSIICLFQLERTVLIGPRAGKVIWTDSLCFTGDYISQ